MVIFLESRKSEVGWPQVSQLGSIIGLSDSINNGCALSGTVSSNSNDILLIWMSKFIFRATFTKFLLFVRHWIKCYRHTKNKTYKGSHNRSHRLKVGDYWGTNPQYKYPVLMTNQPQCHLIFLVFTFPKKPELYSMTRLF